MTNSQPGGRMSITQITWICSTPTYAWRLNPHTKACTHREGNTHSWKHLIMLLCCFAHTFSQRGIFFTPHPAKFSNGTFYLWSSKNDTVMDWSFSVFTETQRSTERAGNEGLIREPVKPVKSGLWVCFTNRAGCGNMCWFMSLLFFWWLPKRILWR